MMNSDKSQYINLFNNKKAQRFLAQREAVVDGSHIYPEFGVTAPLVETEEGLSFLYQVRSSSLEQQPGEVCFPGGKIEAGESARQAAIREASEELLIEESQVEIMGAGDVLVMPFNIILYPFLSRLHHYEFTYSKDEVQDVFTVPLDWLRNNPPAIYKNPIVYELSDRFPFDKLGISQDYPFQQGENPIYYYEFGKHIIWGMTARMTNTFMRLIDSALGLPEGDGGLERL